MPGRRALQLAGLLPVLLAAALLPSCRYRDVLKTWEPDVFHNGIVLEPWQLEGAYRVSPEWNKLDDNDELFEFGLSLFPDHLGAGIGLPQGFEARAGFGRIGSHFALRDCTKYRLHAGELRLYKQLLRTPLLNIAAGGGVDLVTGWNWGSLWYPRVNYYGTRTYAQAAVSSYASFGVGIFVPLSYSWTRFGYKGMWGHSFTPGVGVSYEHRLFSVRFAYCRPLGSYYPTGDSLYLRYMQPYAGIQFRGRVRLFQSAVSSPRSTP